MSRALPQITCQHIFDTIDLELRTPDNPNDQEEYYDRDFKRLASYGQLISASNGSTSSEDSILPFITNVHIRIYHFVYLEPFEDDDDLSHILSRLADSPKPHTLSIHNLDYGGESLAWHDLTTTFRKIICLSSPRLRVFSVNNILEIPETFLRGICIAKLELAESWFRRPGEG